MFSVFNGKKAKQCENISEGISKLPLGHHKATALQNIMVILTSGHCHPH